MRYTRIALLSLIVLAGATSAGERTHTPTTDTPITNASVRAAAQWQMTPEEWTRYRAIAEGPASYRHGDRSPLYVMALYTEGDEQRRWIERLVRYEKAENDREIRANRLFHETAMRLFPPAAASRALAAPLPASRYLAFVSAACPACDRLLPRLFALAERVHVDLYLVGAEGPAAVAAWAVRNGVPRRLVPQRLTINVDDGTLARLGGLAFEVPALYAVDDGQHVRPLATDARDALLSARPRPESDRQVAR